MKKNFLAALAIGFFFLGIKGVVHATTITDLGSWTANGITHAYQAYTDPDSTVNFTNGDSYSNLMLWDTARTTADSMSLNGMSGHLATFTSTEENSAVWGMIVDKGLGSVGNSGDQISHATSCFS